MKTIYVSHSTQFDFAKDLYPYLQSTPVLQFILPHEKSLIPTNSKKRIQDASAVLAELSHPSHGVGIELGWANAFGVPIIGLYQREAEISSSLAIVCNTLMAYDELPQVIENLDFALAGKKEPLPPS